jgi:hypothetical protein
MHRRTIDLFYLAEFTAAVAHQSVRVHSGYVGDLDSHRMSAYGSSQLRGTQSSHSLWRFFSHSLLYRSRDASNGVERGLGKG